MKIFLCLKDFKNRKAVQHFQQISLWAGSQKQVFVSLQTWNKKADVRRQSDNAKFRTILQNDWPGLFENINVLKEKRKAGHLIYIKRRKRPQWPQHTPDLRSGCPAPSPHAKKDTTTQPGKNEYGPHIQFFQNKVGGKSNESVFKGWKPVGLFSRRRRVCIRSYKTISTPSKSKVIRASAVGPDKEAGAMRGVSREQDSWGHGTWELSHSKECPKASSHVGRDRSDSYKCSYLVGCKKTQSREVCQLKDLRGLCGPKATSPTKKGQNSCYSLSDVDPSANSVRMCVCAQTHKRVK